MKHILLYLALLATGFGFLQAQTAHVTRMDFPKTGKIDVVTITFDGEEKNVEKIMADLIQRETGAKPKSYKGYKTVTGIRHRTISHQNLDLFYKVDKAGSKESPQSRVYMAISLGNNTFMEEAKYPDEFRAAKEKLEELPRETRIFELNLVIEEQQEMLSEAMEDYEKMGTDSLTLETTLLETQQAIEENKLAREAQRVKMTEEEALLESYKTRLNETRNGSAKKD